MKINLKNIFFRYLNLNLGANNLGDNVMEFF